MKLNSARLYGIISSLNLFYAKSWETELTGAKGKTRIHKELVMKLVSFTHNGSPSFGALRDGKIVEDIEYLDTALIHKSWYGRTLS